MPRRAWTTTGKSLKPPAPGALSRLCFSNSGVSDLPQRAVNALALVSDDMGAYYVSGNDFPLVRPYQLQQAASFTDPAHDW